MKTVLLTLLTSLAISMTGQTSLSIFLDETDQLLEGIVQNNQVNYQNAKGSAALNVLIKRIGQMDTEELTDTEEQAFLINAYNLIVIKEAASSYPIQSVQDIGGFFNRKKFKIGKNNYTLNYLEKDVLIKKYNDPRFHFALVCGAKGCPVIVDQAYRPDILDQQLETQTRKALNDSNFLYVKDNTLYLSQIFNWYKADFGGKRKIIPFINKYIDSPISEQTSISHYKYDWALNDVNANSANAFRYVVSAAIPQGGVELKLFNNLYTQRTGDGENLNSRSTFFTSSLSALYGLTNRFNAGLELRYRRVSNADLPSSPFSVLGSGGNAISSRSGITAIGPRIRFAPFKKLENFSIQTTLSFPVGDQLEGDGTRPFIDWNAPTFNTQLFNDHSIGSSFSLFTELDILIEDIGGDGGLNRFSTPVTGILSYFPNPKTTIYALGSFSPYWQSNFDYFVQAGAGVKYQITPSYEVELLVTKFANQFLIQNNGDAATYNIGFRYSY